MTDLQQRLARLTPQQRALLARRMATPLAGPPPIQPQSRATPAFPLSFGQQRLWFLDQWDPGSPIYNCPVLTRLCGLLDRPALQRSLDALVARHETLRTTFPMVDGQPRQVIGPPVPVPLLVIDLREAPAALETALGQEARRPFDLGQGPLFRATLFRLAADEHLLLIVSHHIITDGWSDNMLLSELGACYGAFSAGQTPALPPLPIQYVDFAVWQRDTLQGALLDAQIEYWRTRLAGAPTTLDLPADRPRPTARAGRGELQQFAIPAEVTAGLRTIQQREGGTLFMVSLAAFAVLLHRYTGRADLLIGTPIAGRNQPAIEGIVGFFVNNLVLRVDLRGNPSFRTLLMRVREMLVEAYDHQDVPFERLVDALGLERSLSYTPLVQTMFSFLPRDAEQLTLGDLRVSRESVGTGTARFDLVVSLVEMDQELRGAVEYDTELFDDSTITRLIAHYQVVLAGIAAAPDARIHSLPLLLEDERRQVLDEWNAPAGPLPDRAISEIFALQAAAHPDSIAVVAGEQQLTYAALDAQANQLAHYLQACGVGPEMRIALYLERSPLAIVAPLAVLKAGGVYVPLDPAAPVARLAFVLADTQATLVLTQQSMRARLPATTPVVELDGASALWLSAPPTPCALRTTPDHLAYIMYTSGSTGRPKGIAIPQRGVIRLVTQPNYAWLGPDEIILQAASPAFDAATFEIWGSLLNGARLVLAPIQQPSLAELADLLDHYQVTTLWLTAGLFHQLVEHHPEVLARRRQVLAGGDVLSRTHVRQLLSQMGADRLINGYGPTENTTFTCCYPMDATAVLDGSVPIGRPITNTTVYVLDRQMRPVPVGIPGELYTGGAGLARGYWQQPALTAAAFVPDPFGGSPGARLYRTGDLARWRADGTVEFLGRRDQQVKIRGFRVELEEIETALQQHPAVRAAVVVARDDPTGGRRLVAYLVGPAARPATSDLNAFLRQTLPDYMIPAAVVWLDTLPLNANGKVDRQALPAPDTTAQLITAVAPRTPLEEVVAGIWGATLNLDQVGVHDNFFALGGHSLLATQVVAQVREFFQVELPIRILFEYPTVADFVTVLLTQVSDPAHVERTAALLLELNAETDEELAARLAAARGTVEER